MLMISDLCEQNTDLEGISGNILNLVQFLQTRNFTMTKGIFPTGCTGCLN